MEPQRAAVVVSWYSVPTEILDLAHPQTSLEGGGGRRWPSAYIERFQ